MAESGAKTDVSSLLVEFGLEDLNRKPNHTHAAIPLASYERLRAYLGRVDEIVRLIRTTDMSGMDLPWIADRFEGKDESVEG